MYIRQTRLSGSLNILNIWLDPSPSGVSVVFELCHGKTKTGEWRLASHEFGFQAFDEVPFTGLWFSPGALALVPAVKALLPADGTPLWLSFGTHPDPLGSETLSAEIGPVQSRPSGFVPVISWELNLVQPLARPVLRMQGLPVRPLTQHQTLHVAVCCSFSAAKQIESPVETLGRIFGQIPPLVGQSLTLHVFGDLGLQSYLGELPRVYANVAKVVIYDPKRAAQYGDAERVTTVPDDPSVLQNPWMLWMRDSLSKTGIDAVQFITHGFSDRGRGALAFAESPVHNQDRRWARFVGTGEISMFLEQLGAWSVILTSPLSNFSVPGLRILQDELTDYVSGPVMLYEMADDPMNNDLRTAFDYIFNLSELTPPVGRAISLYTHPDWKRPIENEEATPTADWIEQFTLAGRLRDNFASQQEVPAWIAAGQRSLERSVAKMKQATDDDEVTRAARQGKQEALRFAADLFAKFARPEMAERSEDAEVF